MSIDQKDIVDFISTSQNGKIVLTISDHLPWDSKNEHLLMLQEKLNSYLSFIESGEIFESYPMAKGNSVIIQVCLKYEPNETALFFLSRCAQTITNAGIEFKWQKIYS